MPPRVAMLHGGGRKKKQGPGPDEKAGAGAATAARRRGKAAMTPIPGAAIKGPGGFVFDEPLEPEDIAKLDVPEAAGRVMRRYELSRDRFSRSNIVPQGRRRDEVPEFRGRNPERHGVFQAQRRGGAAAANWSDSEPMGYDWWGEYDDADGPELDLGEDSDSAESGEFEF